MIPISLDTLANVSGGTLYGSDATVNDVVTDTRKVTAGCLFVALVGERFDAHDFVGDAIASGAQALLVSKHLPVAVPQVVVADTRIAFGQLAAWVRQQAKARVVALTGSSGKTSVKEMTAAILRECGETLYTAGNLNNDFGVPMTLLRLTKDHDYAVIELGANHQGEIAYTTDLTRPETALVNNLAAAHLEGFGSLAGVAKAKGEIFGGLPEHGTAIINADSNDLANWQPLLAGKTLWRFSPQPQAEVEFGASDIQLRADATAFTLHTPHGDIAVTLPLPGRHNIANALAAAALALSVDAPLSAIQAGLTKLQPVPGRLFPVRLAEHQLLIDDSYNANVGSMTAAAQVLGDMPGYRVMVVGDMAELGDETESCHRQVGEAAKAAGIDCVLSTGRFSQLISENSGNGEHFASKAALIERLRTLLSEHQELTILIKGSRSAAMEQVVQSLQEKGTC
ncbi:MAG: UDP-N-acetylmuramoyl-tripeptide--D-alanyl-D-alanine ligase [Pantoea sp.]|uniref:UDP-N-acetylmuramoyl-tripeptide--D-alanyl-D- alanine ligase n=1 Tax=unclassified Pantoea TaxID=2630326 RepID=UPI0003AC7B95|nr:UDP-N-acetylmuramoyl-tripeptide--D-alanyl-D-alanine ligase [Pantoea sp. AS-PWVM4]ERK12386.1 UDP-N-acetylmuramoylalanyl-D-glutamyl-2,6-diaminopimelate--D-alanyl-D-alanine ligase [Pantoea sp. AS-PWVM4]